MKVSVGQLGGAETLAGLLPCWLVSCIRLSTRNRRMAQGSKSI